MSLEVFSEERFPEKVSFGMVSDARFFTSITTTQGGREVRVANWQFARHEYRAANEVKNQTEFDELKAFYMARRGPAVGFRFFDWTDFCSDMPGLKSQGLDIDILTLPAPGVLTAQDMRRVSDDGVGLGDGSETQFQLIKTYLAEPRKVSLITGNPTLTFSDSGGGLGQVARSTGSWITDGFDVGDYVEITGGANDSLDATTNARTRSYTVASRTAVNLNLQASDTSYTWTAEGPTQAVRLWTTEDGGTDYFRVINKPIAGAVRAIIGGTAYTEGGGPTGFTLDDTTGILTLNVAAPAGVTAQWDGFYDTPVRFLRDRFPATLQEFNVLEAPIDCIELRP